MINKTIKGDLIKLAKKGNFDAIVHGCNCFCAMGAGIAKTIREEFPEAYKADQATKCGDANKLGHFSMALINYRGLSGGNVAVINAYTQHKYTGRSPVSYDAIEKVFADLNTNFRGDIIGIPKIGAGLAGGDWDKIAKIINKATPNLDIILVEYSG